MKNLSYVLIALGVVLLIVGALLHFTTHHIFHYDVYVLGILGVILAAAGGYMMVKPSAA